MRKHAERTKSGSPLKVQRFRIVAVVGVVLVFAIVATAISMQARKSEAATRNDAAKVAGISPSLRSMQTAQTSTQSQIRPLTQEEAKRLGEGIKNLLSQDTEGLTQVRHADGSVSMDLEGRFQSVAVAKRNEDGKVVQSCVDNRQAAAAFFGIDPQLVGVPAGVNSVKAAEKGDKQ